MADVLFSFPPDNVARLLPKTYDNKITEYLTTLSKVPQSTWTKTIDKQNILDILNPAVNTIPYLYAIQEQWKAKKDVESTVNRAIVFFNFFDPVQARYVGEEWTSLLVWFLDALSQSQLPDLRPVSAAILRLDPTAGTFTTTHLRFVRQCLHSGVPSQALPILDRNIYAYPHTSQKGVPEELPSEDLELSNAFITSKSGFSGKITVEYVLEYYLLGAQVYIGLRNYNRARLFLEYIILTPGVQNSTSAFQVEAYKKWIMIGLLAEGKMWPQARTADGAVMKSLRNVAKPYEALAEDFEKRDWRKYQAEMDVGTQIWVEDGNLRLVKEASDALLRFRIIDLQKTYATLPVSRVASHIAFSADVTLQFLTEMIRTGHLKASITQASTSSGDSVLSFHTASPTTSSGNAEDDELQAQTKRIEDLVAFVRDADRRLQLTKEYVQSQKRTKQLGGPDGDLADQMDLSWDPTGGLGDDDEYDESSDSEDDLYTFLSSNSEDSDHSDSEYSYKSWHTMDSVNSIIMSRMEIDDYDGSIDRHDIAGRFDDRNSDISLSSRSMSLVDSGSSVNSDYMHDPIPEEMHAEMSIRGDWRDVLCEDCLELRRAGLTPAA